MNKRFLHLSHKQSLWAVAALLVLYVLSVVINLGVLELSGEEPRRAVVSLEMMHSGNYLNPTLLGWPYFNKPPVFNWILVGFVRLFGSASEFVFRLPSLFFYLVWAAIHYAFCKKYLGKKTALLSAFFLLTSVDVYFYGLANGAEIDIFYSFIVYLQAIAIFHYGNRQQWLALFLYSYLFCLIGFLTKGFPSVLFQGLTLVAFCFYVKSFRLLFRWQHLAGIGLFVAAMGLYLWGYGLQGNVSYLLVNLLNESFIKSAIGERSGQVIGKAVGYPLMVLKLMAPWSLLLLLLLFKRVRSQVWTNPFIRFAVLFFACNIWVYWFSGFPKARYIYMFVPFGVSFFAWLYQAYVKDHAGQFDRILRWWVLIFVIAATSLFAATFFTGVNTVACMVAAAVLAGFSWLYWKAPATQRLWAMIAGVMLLRLVYAVVFIPLQDQGTRYFEPHLQAAARQLQGEPLQFWGPPEPFQVAVDTRLVHWQAGSTKLPPFIYYQVPYYHYKHTGKLLLYTGDQTPGSSYLSFAAPIAGKAVDTVYSFFNREQTEQMVVYRLK